MTEPLLKQYTVEPQTTMERMAFIRQVSKEYFQGRISWQELWYYEQAYGVGGGTDGPKEGEGMKGTSGGPSAQCDLNLDSSLDYMDIMLLGIIVLVAIVLLIAITAYPFATK